MLSLVKKFIPQKYLDFFHFFETFFGALVFGFPAKKIKVIAITGTNGKTTTVHLVSHILEELGFKVASVSSLRFKVGKKEWLNKLKMTMPGRWHLQRFLRQALDKGAKVAVLEVTSEGIKQYRHKFLYPKVALLTNITPEHIESHGSFENYKKAKFKLFKETKDIHIFNLDDENSLELLKVKSFKKIGYTLFPKKDEDFKGKVDLVVCPEKVLNFKDKIEFFYKGLKFQSSLFGIFNLYNILSALAVSEALNLPLEKVALALKEFKKVEGRLEEVISSPFKVIVDYAHTPDALEKVYLSLKKKYSGNFICVFGSAGGGRDKWKRSQLAEIASKFCSFVVLTNEDPYDEDPKKILNDIEKGFIETGFKNYVKVLDRKLAIKKALLKAKKEDVVVITGKGAEPLMCLAKGKKIAWDDRKIVGDVFKKLTLS